MSSRTSARIDSRMADERPPVGLDERGLGADRCTSCADVAVDLGRDLVVGRRDRRVAAGVVDQDLAVEQLVERAAPQVRRDGDGRLLGGRRLLRERVDLGVEHHLVADDGGDAVEARAGLDGLGGRARGDEPEGGEDEQGQSAHGRRKRAGRSRRCGCRTEIAGRASARRRSTGRTARIRAQPGPVTAICPASDVGERPGMSARPLSRGRIQRARRASPADAGGAVAAARGGPTRARAPGTSRRGSARAGGAPTRARGRPGSPR